MLLNIWATYVIKFALEKFQISQSGQTARRRNVSKYQSPYNRCKDYPKIQAKKS